MEGVGLGLCSISLGWRRKVSKLMIRSADWICGFVKLCAGVFWYACYY
jgi:hypothetical protein